MSPEKKIHKLVEKKSGKLYTAAISWEVFEEEDYPHNNRAYGALKRLEKAGKIKSVKEGKYRFWVFVAR